MSNIEWGPAIEVDGKRPAWLVGADKFQWEDGNRPFGVWNDDMCTTGDTFCDSSWWRLTYIRLPADHPHYRQPIDWSAPIEAVHEDGRVVAVKISMGPYAGNQYDLTPELPNDDPEGFGHFTFAEDGSHHIAKWRIRNVATKPVRTAAEMLGRLEALARRLAAPDQPGVHYVTQMEPLREEARAIVAEMTPPVDPDLIEARKIAAEAEDAPHGTLEDVALAAIKRGRELERGA